MDMSSPQDRLLLAYQAWQYNRINAGFAITMAGPEQATIMAVDAVQWAVELDAVWQVLDGDTYRQLRDDNPADGVLTALAGLRSSIGVLRALHVDEAGAIWRPAQDLPDLPAEWVDAYTQHLDRKDFSDTDSKLVAWFLNTTALEGTQGQTVIAEAPEVSWEVGDPTPNELDPEFIKEADARFREDLRLEREEPPAVYEAIKAADGHRFLTVITGDEGLPVSKEFEVFRAAYGLLYMPTNGMTQAGGMDRIIFSFGPPYADDLVSSLACVARAVNPGTWEVIEGFRPYEEEEGNGET